MSFIDRLFGIRESFISSDGAAKNLATQLEMTPKTVAQLRKYGVTEYKSLKLEFFFYTNQLKKGDKLSRDLRNRGYMVECQPTPTDATMTLITGWTVPIVMSDDAVLAWTREMCAIGHRYDCEFDGWGTNPN